MIVASCNGVDNKDDSEKNKVSALLWQGCENCNFYRPSKKKFSKCRDCLIEADKVHNEKVHFAQPPLHIHVRNS